MDGKTRKCRECAHYYESVDKVFGGVQGNCPWHFGVTHAFAVRYGVPVCVHWKEKVSA